MNLRVFENGLLERFKRFAGQYLQGARIPTNDLEWLALMQHHGAPTRLLDWTWSPYVATFFALEEARGDAAVWALGDWRLRNAGEDLLRVEFDCPDLILRVTSSELHLAALEDEITGVYVVEPFEQNERLRIQQGAFLVGGNGEMSFLENLVRMNGFDSSTALCKIIILHVSRMDALAGLQLMNVTRASLFPGLDGFAQNLQYEVDRAFTERTDPVFSAHRNELPADFGSLRKEKVEPRNSR